MNSMSLFSNKFLIFSLVIYGITMQNKAFSNIYKYNFTSIEGQIIKLEDFKGKPILIVNSASLCGFTNQYEDLEEINIKYKDRGLIVISVPSNDFGSQELSSNEKVNDFCKTNFNTTFLLTEITKIKGKEGHPLFKWVKAEAGLLAFPKWNFYKYLVNKDGNLDSWYSSVTKPSSKKIKTAIEKLISSK